MLKCSVCIQAEYEGKQDADRESLESLADALVTTEYLLDELESGRGIDGGVSRLIDESLQALA